MLRKLWRIVSGFVLDVGSMVVVLIVVNVVLLAPPALLMVTPIRSPWLYFFWFGGVGSLLRRLRGGSARLGRGSVAGGRARRVVPGVVAGGEDSAVEVDGRDVAVTAAAERLRGSVLADEVGEGPIAKRGPDRSRTVLVRKA